MNAQEYRKELKLMLDSPVTNLANALATGASLAQTDTHEPHPAYKEWALKALSMKVSGDAEAKPPPLSDKAIEAIINDHEWPIPDQSTLPMNHISAQVQKMAMEFLNEATNLQYLLEPAYKRMLAHMNRAGFHFNSNARPSENLLHHMAIGTAGYLCLQRKMQMAEEGAAAKIAPEATTVYQEEATRLIGEFAGWLLGDHTENQYLVSVHPAPGQKPNPVVLSETLEAKD